MVVHLLPLILLITRRKNEIAYVLEKYECSAENKDILCHENNVCIYWLVPMLILSVITEITLNGRSLLADKFIFTAVGMYQALAAESYAILILHLLLK